MGAFRRSALPLAFPLALGCMSAARAEDERETAPVPEGEKVVVTGTRLRPAEAQDAQDVHVYDRERIERSGMSTLGAFLATVPEASLNSSESTFGATTIRLRGAREGSTLILLNGRRTQAVTGGAALIGFFDLNTIPLSMVERIDVLPTGSSAIYGGEALAGVVNIVLRSGFSGADVSLGYRGARNTDEKLVSGGAGWKGDAASVSLMASYSDRSPMSGADRDITNDSDLRRFGGPNLASPFFGTPATIFAASGNLPGVGTAFAAVPHGSTGVGLRPADFAATAGTQNYGSFNHYQDLVLHAIRKGFFASGEYRLRAGVQLFAEFLASDYRFEGKTTPPALLQATVPATNAFNPFGVDVRAAGVVRGTEPLATFTFGDELVRPVLGARGPLGQWDWEASVLASRDRGGQHIRAQPNAAALNAALASSNPATALNPFIDGPMASPSLLASIFNQTNDSTWRGDATVVNAFARGPAMRLPAGPLDVVFGAEYERSGLARDMDATRSARALFGEVRVPLFSTASANGDRREVVALQAAVRRDDYSDFGAKTTGQASFELRPVSQALVRGTYATAFKPPTLYNLYAPASSGALPANDPLRNGESVVLTSMQGGNAGLQPTTSRSGTLGIVWSPSSVPALNFTLTGWTLQIDNAVTLPNVQYIIDNETRYPGRVVRGPAAAGGVGSIVSVDGSYINFGTMRERGFDGSIDWSFGTGLGRFTPAAAATYFTKFSGTSAPGGPEVDRLSHAMRDGIFAPRVKANVSLGWDPHPAFRAWVGGRYVGRYYDYTLPRTIGDIWYVDGSIELDLERALGRRKGSVGGLRILLSATNLADKLPTWSTHFRGYDVYNYDLIGRTIFVRLQARM
jgi:iron complex outermembrane receptor protein